MGVVSLPGGCQRGSGGIGQRRVACPMRRHRCEVFEHGVLHIAGSVGRGGKRPLVCFSFGAPLVGQVALGVGEHASIGARPACEGGSRSGALAALGVRFVLLGPETPSPAIASTTFLRSTCAGRQGPCLSSWIGRHGERDGRLGWGGCDAQAFIPKLGGGPSALVWQCSGSCVVRWPSISLSSIWSPGLHVQIFCRGRMGQRTTGLFVERRGFSCPHPQQSAPVFVRRRIAMRPPAGASGRRLSMMAEFAGETRLEQRSEWVCGTRGPGWEHSTGTCSSVRPCGRHGNWLRTTWSRWVVLMCWCHKAA